MLVERAALLQRYSQLFDGLIALNHQPPANQKLDPEAPFFLDLLDAYRKVNPKEASRVLALMIDTTYGAIADVTLAAQFETLAAHGRSGMSPAAAAQLPDLLEAMTRVGTYARE